MDVKEFNVVGGSKAGMKIPLNMGTFGLAFSILPWLMLLPLWISPPLAGGWVGDALLSLTVLVSFAAFMLSVIGLFKRSSRKYAIAGALISGTFLACAFGV